MQIVVHLSQSYKEFEPMFVEVIGQVVSQVSAELNLSQLDTIVVAENFAEELIEFQKKKGVPYGYTNNGLGVVMGKTISYGKGDDFRVTVFLHAELVARFFGDEQAEKHCASHIIHHELCHVHDETVRAWMRERQPETAGPNLHEQMLDHAIIFWSEYIATRLSSRTKPGMHDLWIEYLLELIDQVEERCAEYITSYRSHADISQVWGEVQIDVNLLMRIAVSTMGYIDGLEMSNHEVIIQLIAQRIHPTYLGKTWAKLSQCLKTLYEKYPTWSGINELDPLCDIVLELWPLFGLYPEQMESGIYIAVPGDPRSGS